MNVNINANEYISSSMDVKSLLLEENQHNHHQHQHNHHNHHHTTTAATGTYFNSWCVDATYVGLFGLV